MDDVTDSVVPAGERIESEYGYSQEAESAEVTPGKSVEELEAEMERLRQELERERKGRKSFQSEKDKLEARLKELERAEMDERERLQAELQDLQLELQQEKLINWQLYLEKMKRELAEEYKIPTRFLRYIYGRDEDELRECAENLARDIQELGAKEAEQKAQTEERPPFVPGGVPAVDIEAELDELRKKGDLQGVIRRKLFGRA